MYKTLIFLSIHKFGFEEFDVHFILVRKYPLWLHFYFESLFWIKKKYLTINILQKMTPKNYYKHFKDFFCPKFPGPNFGGHWVERSREVTMHNWLHVLGTNLLNFVLKRQTMEETLIWSMTTQCLSALKYLDEHQIKHLDLKRKSSQTVTSFFTPVYLFFSYIFNNPS